MLQPIDIHNAEFKRSFKGYNEEEVDAFLVKIVSAYETVYNDNKKLKEQIQELEDNLKKYQNKEDDIYGLITLTKEATAEAKEIADQQAQSVVDEANLKAKVIIDEAKFEAKQMIAETESYLEQMNQKLKTTKLKEQEFKKKMQRLMETFWAMLEDVEESVESNQHREDNPTKVYRELAVTDDDAENT